MFFIVSSEKIEIEKTEIIKYFLTYLYQLWLIPLIDSILTCRTSSYQTSSDNVACQKESISRLLDIDFWKWLAPAILFLLCVSV